jgi:hypothetical protein
MLTPAIQFPNLTKPPKLHNILEMTNLQLILHLWKRDKYNIE